MCNTKTIQTYIISKYYSNSYSQYLADVVHGMRHQCDGEFWFECDTCDRIKYCDCHEQNDDEYCEDHSLQYDDLIGLDDDDDDYVSEYKINQSYNLDCKFTRAFIRNPHEPDQGYDLRMSFLNELPTAYIKHHFKNQITKELIASAMKPSRIEAQMNQFDNIEDFFEAIGC